MHNTATLPLLLKELRLSTIAKIWEETINTAQDKNWSYERCLAALCEREIASRYSKRIQCIMSYFTDRKISVLHY